MDNTEYMTTIEAMQYVSEMFGIKTLYALSKALSDEFLTVQPIQLSRYMKGGKMSAKVAKRFEDTFGVAISDYVSSGTLRREYRK